MIIITKFTFSSEPTKVFIAVFPPFFNVKLHTFISKFKYAIILFN